MLTYDMPTIDVKSHESDTVCRRRNKKSKGLTFAVWQSTLLALVAYALTALRYFDLLDTVVDATRRILGI